MSNYPASASKQLGVKYTPTQSLFKLWAPTADQVLLCLYETGGKTEDTLLKKLPMKRSGNLWTLAVKEDLKGRFYTYQITRKKKTVETVDLYAKAVGLNGDRGAILDPADTDPVAWQEDRRPDFSGRITDALIWETHIADFSSDPAGGFSPETRGKYAAFTQINTHLADHPEIATGVAYLKQLGVNYVHLLPTFDFDNDETGTAYNWGYDPKNYNVPEGRYATDPADTACRIREFKQLVQALHNAGIGVILDVVYNHTSRTVDSWFNLTEPNYFYRQDADGGFADGSACGNEVASERPMVRKYIVESVLHWATEYHLDGFRFDLMGLLDVTTMNLIRRTLNKNGLEKVLMYGEPWDAGSNEIKEPDLAANKNNLSRLDPGIAVFNDDFRDSMKGFVFEEGDGAFIQGQNGKKQKERTYHDGDLMAAVLANSDPSISAKSPLQPLPWAKNPSQVVTYVAAHDNLTLWDKLCISTAKKKQVKFRRKEKLVQMNKMAAALQFTSLGGMFLQAGEEFARTKLGDENSFVSPIAVNQLDWNRLTAFGDLTAFYHGMWQIRQQFSPLRAADDEAGRSYRFAKDQTENLIAYTIFDESASQGAWQQLAVIVNSSQNPQKIKLRSVGKLPEKWTVIANNQQAGTTPLGTITGKKIKIPGRSLLVLVAEPTAQNK